MDWYDQSHSLSPGSPPKKKAKTMNLQKCDFCRDRKVRCEPPNRTWPDKCHHCKRRGEKCSQPSFATRRPKTRQTSGSSTPNSFSHRVSTEASTALHGNEPQDAEERIALPIIGGGIELMYLEMKDVVTVLRCHHLEYRVELSQALGLEKLFRKNGMLRLIDKKLFRLKVTKRLHTITRIQKLTLDHVRSLLESHCHSSADRISICQLLVDLGTSFSAFTSDLETVNHQRDPVFATTQRILATLLCETGDYHGALTVLHRIPLSQIEKKDLNRIVEIGVAICARAKAIPNLLGIGDDPMTSAIFECLDVLVLPYSLLAAHSSHWTDSGIFIKKSFMWPWIRRSIQAQLRDQPGAAVEWRPSRLDSHFRDAFGHTFLHAAIYSQDNDHTRAIIENSLELGHEDVRASLSAALPSYAPGFTPLACSASFVANWEIFQLLVSFSGKSLCCGSTHGAVGHEFCALTCAIRDKEHAVMEALVQSSCKELDITDCCQWGMNFVPGTPPETLYFLVEAVRRHIASRKEDAQEVP